MMDENTKSITKKGPTSVTNKSDLEHALKETQRLEAIATVPSTNADRARLRTLSEVAIGETVIVEWNHEPVRLVFKSDSRAVIKPLSGPEREVSPGVEVLPYDPANLVKSDTSHASTSATLTLNGQIYRMRTLHDLALLICRLRHQEGVRESPDAEKIIQAGQKYGLLDANGKITSRYFALVDDDVEQMAREVTADIQTTTTEITFKDFSNLAKRRGHTVESLAALFRGKLDLSGNPVIGANDTRRAFFDRVISCRHNGEDLSDVVIPYAPVIDFYKSEVAAFIESEPKHPKCACGCGLPVFERKKWASPACSKRSQSPDLAESVVGVPENEAAPTMKRAGRPRIYQTEAQRKKAYRDRLAGKRLPGNPAKDTPTKRPSVA
jgi:hypothetical protein